MANDTSKLTINNTTYDIKDANARCSKYQYTLNKNNWSNNTYALSVSASNIDCKCYNTIELSNYYDINQWKTYGISIESTEKNYDGTTDTTTLSTIYFKCETVPESNLKFAIASFPSKTSIDGDLINPYNDNDYTNADKSLVQDSPITTTVTGSNPTLSTSAGNIGALTVYGKSEIVDGSIKSAGEGWATVKLADLTWIYDTAHGVFLGALLSAPNKRGEMGMSIIYNSVGEMSSIDMPDKSLQLIKLQSQVWIKDTNYNTVSDFVTSLGDATLCYEEAAQTSNTIAIKTDNGSGIDGTMAVFTTGTPLRGIPNIGIRDTAQWDGLTGIVTKKCEGLDLSTLTWAIYSQSTTGTDGSKAFIHILDKPAKSVSSDSLIFPAMSNYKLDSYYKTVSFAEGSAGSNALCQNINGTAILIRVAAINTLTDLQAYLNNNPITLVYELATPTAQTLTATENASIATLRTFSPETHIQNNADTDMTVKAYAGTQNGKAITEIADKIDVLTPKVYNLFVAKTDWDETGMAEIDVPGTFGYSISSENYNQLVLSDEETNYWRTYNVHVDSVYDDASGKITTIEFSCDYNNIPNRPIFFSIVSSKSEYVNWSAISDLIVPSGLQVDTKLDSYSTNPVQNKVVKTALDSIIDDTIATSASTYSSEKIEDLIERRTEGHYVFSVVIDHNNNNPVTCVKPHYDVRYGCDNYNYTPAKMNYTTDKFDYGSWENWVLKHFKPCMVKYNGTVDYYLDPNDYSKKLDGSASDVADMSYGGNAMVEIDTIYKKAYTANGKDYIWLSDRKLDKSFKAYAHHDKNSNVLPHIYRACYDGSYDGTRLRSISGIDYHNLNTLTINKIMSNTTRAQEISFAQANNDANEEGEGWYILHKSEWDLINDVLIVMGLNLDTQAVFGRGRDSGYVSTSDTGIISTGTMDTKGLFWGKNDGSAGVKVLGIENPWANIWKSCAGWIVDARQHKIKMTYGTEDGSTDTGFNTNGTGYVATGYTTGTANGYINNWIEDDTGFLPTEAGGTGSSSSTYRCDYLWQSTGTYFALVGGGSYIGLLCGAFCAFLDNSAAVAGWYIGAALSYKPLAGGELAA